MPKNKLDRLPAFARYAIVTGSSLVFAVCCCMIMSAIALKSENPTANLALYGEIIFLASMTFCGFTGAKTATEGKLLCGLLSAALMLAIVTGACIAIGEAELLKAAILIVSGALCALLGSLIGAKEKRRKRKKC